MMKYSVIVPVYGCARDLPDCVSSILQQTETDFELLLVDDGATDGSGALCDRLARQDARIRVFHKVNGGASSARNLGLEHASGEYVLFFDGDDTVEPDLLERVSAALADGSPQMVIFGMAFDYYSASGTLERTENLSVQHHGCVSPDEIRSDFSDYFEDNALSSACNKVFSGRILRETGLRFSEDMTLYEDLDFVLRYLPYCGQVACADRALYHYRLSMQAPHINQRVSNLEKLQRNLELLTGSVLALESRQAAQRTADLCAQLFDQHLMASAYSRRELAHAVSAIRESAALRALANAGVQPSVSASASWPMVSGGAEKELYAALQKRRMIRKTKQIIKPVLKKAGLYH